MPVARLIRLIMKLLTVLSLFAVTPAPGPARDAASLVELPRAIATTVDKLDSPDWQTRDEAEFELQGVDPTWADKFREVAMKAATVEASLRLKRLTEELYVAERLGPAPAFLGISHEQVSWESDPRVVPGFAGLRIRYTIPNTAAERARLQPDDLIVAVDGFVPRSLEDCVAATRRIAGHKPGETCDFVLLRGVTGLHLNSRSVNGFDPRGMRNARTRVITSADDPRLIDDAVGLQITASHLIDSRLGIQTGDIIIGLNGAPIPAQDPQGALAAWSAAREAEVMPVPQRIAGLRMPSMQIIRGGRRIRAAVRLGRVPLSVAEQSGQRQPSIRGASPERVRELRDEFERWWWAGGSPAGAQTTADPAARWQMMP